MGESSPFDAERDIELGAAMRDALEMPFGGAFVNRVRARLSQRRARSWDDELAGWFWQGLIAASLVTVLAGWGLQMLGSTDDIDTPTQTVASQLLEGSQPGVNVLLASLSTRESP
jgi:hypothetical protein